MSGRVYVCSLPLPCFCEVSEGITRGNVPPVPTAIRNVVRAANANINVGLPPG